MIASEMFVRLQSIVVLYAIRSCGVRVAATASFAAAHSRSPVSEHLYATII